MERKHNKQQKRHIRTGDTVIVTAGNAKGAVGEVKEILVEKNRAIVSGVNMITKNVKPTAQSPQGDRIQIEGSIHMSNLSIYENGKAVRTGRKLNKDGKLQRYSKATGDFI
jgi:large subunit ribosomal protein L24